MTTLSIIYLDQSPNHAVSKERIHGYANNAIIMLNTTCTVSFLSACIKLAASNVKRKPS